MFPKDKRAIRRWRSPQLRAALVAFGIGLTGPAPAQESFPLTGPDDRKYAACMETARKTPKEGLALATDWERAGGGNPALHCLAVSLLGLGEFAQAAETLETLAKEAEDAPPALRADILGQAGNAWTMARQPGPAWRAQSAALALVPDNVDLLIDRGVTLASAGKYWDALDDLNRALTIDPRRVDALVYRAAAWRYAESLELAEEDAVRALALAPDNPDALLERGLIRKARGNRAGARADWLKVRQITPDSPTGEAAGRELEKMDVKTPR